MRWLSLWLSLFPLVCFAGDWQRVNISTTINFETIDFADNLYGWGVEHTLGVDRDPDTFSLMGTEDGGQSWQVLKRGNGHISFDRCSRDDGWLLAERVLWRTYDGGNHWSRRSPESPIRQFSMVDTLVGWAIGFDNDGSIIYFTNSGGRAWSIQAQIEKDWPHCMTTLDNLHCWIAFNNRSLGAMAEWYLYSTENGGSNWEIVSRQKGRVDHMQFTRPDIGWINQLWMGEKGDPPKAHLFSGLFKTEDKGETWYQVDPFPGGGAYGFSFHDCKRGWLSANSGKLYETSDGGSTWLEHNVDNPPVYLRCFTIVDSNNIWAIGDDGTFLKYRFNSPINNHSPSGD